MIVLGIETSCDETSAALYDGSSILSNVIFSQVDTHKAFGGVVPEIAAREHMNKLPVVVEETLKKAGLGFKDLDAVAVTHAPGLAGSLITGLSYAKALSYALGKKFIAVNHIEAHLLSPFLEYDDFDYPFIGLVVSGGHTSIYIAKKFMEYELIGATRDDAAGEAFDKAAKMMGLPYPGGPSLSRAALKGRPEKIIFPQAQMKDSSFDFSFSGIKTSVLYYIEKNRDRIKKGEITIPDIAAAFQKSVTRSIVNKLRRVYKKYGIKRIAVSGGVAANGYLKAGLNELGAQQGVKVYVPSPLLCTDNGAMIAYVGYERLKRGIESSFDIEAEPCLQPESR